MPLLDERAEHVRQGLVEGARLGVVLQVRGVLRDAVAELVPGDVEAAGERGEQDAVAVPVHHLLAVPERVVVLVAVMDGRHHAQPGAVDRVAAVRGLEEVERRAEPVVGLVGRLVAAGGGALGADRAAGQLLAVPGVADRPVGDEVLGRGGAPAAVVFRSANCAEVSASVRRARARSAGSSAPRAIRSSMCGGTMWHLMPQRCQLAVVQATTFGRTPRPNPVTVCDGCDAQRYRPGDLCKSWEMPGHRRGIGRRTPE